MKTEAKTKISVSEFQLTREIIALSQASTWQKAKLEWHLQEVYDEVEPDSCLCGHFPINEICVIANRKNGNTAIVGNVCVKKFLGLPSGAIFQAVKGVKRGTRKAFNKETVLHAHKSGWITNWERDFYMNTMRKRNLSEKQAAMRKHIKRQNSF